VHETGTRTELQLTVGDLQPGQSETLRAPVSVKAAVAAAEGVELVEFLRNGETVHAVNPRGTQRLSRELLRVTWGPAAGVVWDGYLEVLDNEIRSVEPYGLPAPALHPLSPRRVAWTAVTGDGPQGLVLRLRSSYQGVMRFQTQPCAFTQRLSDFPGRRLVVGERVALCRLPEIPAPCEVQVSWLDAPAPGGHEYQVRVLQVDGVLWTSEPLSVSIIP
jgi:hypothetical protein